MSFYLTEKQWDRLSEILGNLGVAFLVSGVLPFIFESKTTGLSVLLYGLILFLSSIIGSILIARRTKIL